MTNEELAGVVFAAKCSKGDGDVTADAVLELSSRLDEAVRLLERWAEADDVAEKWRVNRDTRAFLTKVRP